MKEPIFVFTDDIDIFRDTGSATGWLEGWTVDENFKAFDSLGRQLLPEIEVSKRKHLLGLITLTHEKVLLTDSSVLLPDELKKRLINELERRRDKASLNNLDEESLEQIILRCVKVIGYTS